jgi:hypothetical protein
MIKQNTQKLNKNFELGDKYWDGNNRVGRWLSEGTLACLFSINIVFLKIIFDFVKTFSPLMSLYHEIFYCVW